MCIQNNPSCLTERQTQALNNLYLATMEVMNVFAPEMVNDEMRYKGVASLLQNFLLATGGTTGGGTGVKSPLVDTEVEFPIIGDPEPTPPPQPPKPQSEEEVRYAFSSSDGLFRRPKREEDKKYMEENARQYGEPAPLFYFKLYIGEDGTGSFELMPQSGASVAALLAEGDTVLGDHTVTVTGSMEGATSVTTIRRGVLEKEGRHWRVTAPALVAFRTE